MKIFEGKSPTERNKIIAAVVLGALALFAIGYNVIGFFPSRKTSVSITATPTPKAATSPSGDTQISTLPNAEESEFVYTTTPIVYNPGLFYAPDAGRNIFAFYEPPVPTPYSPTPYVPPTMPPVKTPTPPPPPPQSITFVMPQSVYAGSKGFRLEVNGDKFTPETRILFNGNEIPTMFISPQKLVADIPASFIAGAGSIQIMVRTPDGKLYSNTTQLMVQAPPTPQVLYVGAKLSQRNNNNTAYFREQGKTEYAARLNDLISGRFRLISISSSQVILEDVSLGFRYPVPLYRPKPGEITQNPPYPNYNPSQPSNYPINIPNMPMNIPNMPNIPNTIINPTINNPTIPTPNNNPSSQSSVPNPLPTVRQRSDEDDDPER